MCIGSFCVDAALPARFPSIEGVTEAILRNSLESRGTSCLYLLCRLKMLAFLGEKTKKVWGGPHLGCRAAVEELGCRPWSGSYSQERQCEPQFLVASEHFWDHLRTHFAHVQMLRHNFMNDRFRLSSKLCAHESHCRCLSKSKVFQQGLHQRPLPGPPKRPGATETHHFLLKQHLEDLHFCGECQKLFDSFDKYLVHKLKDEDYKMSFSESHRIPGLWLPRLSKKTAADSESEDSDTEESQNGWVASDHAKSELMCKFCGLFFETVSSSHYMWICENYCAVYASQQLGATQSSLFIMPHTVLSLPAPLDPAWLCQKAVARHHWKIKPVSSQRSRDFCDLRVVALKIHQDYVHMDKPYTCSECPEKFKNKGHMVRHYFRTHQKMT
ncbi:hypothetical protein J6590_026638 [Homalodisca vitripennis]|nr:hypothetical protein J6590_026638 [Homalodisca vitripennis]